LDEQNVFRDYNGVRLSEYPRSDEGVPMLDEAEGGVGGSAVMIPREPWEGGGRLQAAQTTSTSANAMALAALLLADR
jgi:hypothetical protein